MPLLNPSLSKSELDPALLDKLKPVKRLCLILVSVVSLIVISGWLMPPLGDVLPMGWQLMMPDTAIALLFLACALEFSEPIHSARIYRISLLLAATVALLTATVLIEYCFHISLGIDVPFFLPHNPQFLPQRFAPQSGAVLLLLATSTLFIRTSKPLLIHVADLLVICMNLLLLVIVSGYIFGAERFVGISSGILTSPQTMFCLVLLGFVAFLRRAECGFFFIFLGKGIGSRIARALAPFLLVLSFLREGIRDRLNVFAGMPEPYVAACVAASATAVSFLLLMFLTRRIYRMEMEIRNLSLTDELTGISNLRGFNLMAEQSLRIARRSQLPFSVLFVDVDNLKKINDSLGHAKGSAALIEVAEMLKKTFRETDVIGRVGGDEFAVVCQCSQVAISIAAHRLKTAATALNLQIRPFPLSFSVGCATADEHAQTSMQELLALADRAMYEEKHRKKQGGSSSAS